MRFRSVAWAYALCAAMLGGIAGCGSSKSDVSGKVTLDGQPIRGAENLRATVYFNPAGAGGVAAFGLLDENGEYRLSSGSEAGVPPGTYNVTFSATQLVPNAAGGAVSGKRISPPRYAVASTSGLSFTVEPGSNTFDLDLKSAP